MSATSRIRFAKPPHWRSGHCSMAASTPNPVDAHDRCHLIDCNCECHQEIAVNTTSTLRILPDLEQGSEAWHDQRRGMVTASVVSQLITASTLKVANNDTSRGLIATLVAERITGYTEPSYMSDDMLRGVMHESIARDRYAEVNKVTVTEVGFMILTLDGGAELGFSPDGLIGDDGLLEIKCPRAKTHIRTIATGRVPQHYMAQCQAGLFVSGRKWIDFVSFCAGQPMWTKRVHPDPKWQAVIAEAVAAFEQAAEQMASDYLGAVVGLPVTEHINNDLGLVF